MTLHRAPSNISKVVKFVRIWGSYNITSGYWRWSPGPKDVSDVELWHGSPPYKFKYTNYQLHRIKTWIQHLQTYMQRKHEKATSAQGPSKRRAHIRQYIWFPSAPKARWSASCSCQSPQSGRQNFRPQRHPNTSRGTFGFCLERVPCVPTCMAEELAIKCPCGNQISKFIARADRDKLVFVVPQAELRTKHHVWVTHIQQMDGRMDDCMLWFFMIQTSKLNVSVINVYAHAHVLFYLHVGKHWRISTYISTVYHSLSI